MMAMKGSRGGWSTTTLVIIVAVVVLGTIVSDLPSHGATAFSTLPRRHVASVLCRAQQADDDGDWQGDVVPNGSIRGCSLTQVGDSGTDWELSIDGEDADLGGFSLAIYKKVTADAKNQAFQGFRPGTIPPHLEPTYRTFAMDECARETIMEALAQNNVNAFTGTREKAVIGSVRIPPPPVKKQKKKRKKRGRKAKAANEEEAEPVEAEIVPVAPKWITYENMQSAIDAGWRPGQSFSFVAMNIQGQKVRNNNNMGLEGGAAAALLGEQ